MKMPKVISLMWLVGIIVLLGVACGPVTGDEPAAGATEDFSTGLATLPSESDLEAAEQPSEPAAVEEADELETFEDDAMNVDEPDEQEDAAEQPEAVTPAVVDLSRLTPPPTSVTSTPREIHAPGSPNPSQAAASRAAVALAGNLTLDVSDVEIVSVEAVEWPDSSLGCPKPGQNYLMVITPGYLVVLEAGGERYEYHTNQESSIVIECTGGARGTWPTLDR